MPPRELSRPRSPTPSRWPGGSPSRGAPAASQASSDDLLGKLAGLRRAFREVAGVVEAMGALRSLGGEDALIEMAMFAQSHEPTLERAWTALAECEDAARRLCEPNVASPIAAPSLAPTASAAPGFAAPGLAAPSLAPGFAAPGLAAPSLAPAASAAPSLAPAASAAPSLAPAASAPPSFAPPSFAPPSEAEAALATDPAPLLPGELGSELPDPRVDEPPAEAARALDADPRPAAGEATGEEEGPVTQVDAPPTRVLVVDDDPAVLRAFRRVLQSDHEIVTARDGSEALQIVLSGARVDAIICDIGMPKLDGPAFFSELFELRPQLMPRVVFCTGAQPNEKTQRFLERLQAPLLYKPVAAAELQRAIDAARAR